MADPKSVQRSKDELFEEEADLSDQMSKLSNIVKRQMKQQKWDRESSAKSVIQSIEKMFLDRDEMSHSVKEE